MCHFRIGELLAERADLGGEGLGDGEIGFELVGLLERLGEAGGGLGEEVCVVRLKGGEACFEGFALFTEADVFVFEGFVGLDKRRGIADVNAAASVGD
ncbi:MAG: hypothetical protein ACK55I_16140, partial [bacterium]